MAVFTERVVSPEILSQIFSFLHTSTIGETVPRTAARLSQVSRRTSLTCNPILTKEKHWFHVYLDLIAQTGVRDLAGYALPRDQEAIDNFLLDWALEEPGSPL